MVENSVEKVENAVGNPASFSQIQWKTQWKKLKDDSSGDKTRERNGRRAVLFRKLSQGFS